MVRCTATNIAAFLKSRTISRLAAKNTKHSCSLRIYLVNEGHFSWGGRIKSPTLVGGKVQGKSFLLLVL